MSADKSENGERCAPRFLFCCVVSEAPRDRGVFLGDAHRESGVFSFCFALGPVESCSPPKLVSSRRRCTPCDGECARGKDV